MPYKTKISCIYTITNIVNKKIYVGYCKNFYERSYSHMYNLRAGTHKNCHLQRSFNKYGENNFLIEILEEYDIDFLVSMEHYWCNILSSFNDKYGFNIKPTSPIGANKVQSKETREKISKAHKGKIMSKEWKKNLSEAHKGYKQSEETKRKRAEKLKGFKHSEESKKNMSEGIKRAREKTKKAKAYAEQFKPTQQSSLF